MRGEAATLEQNAVRQPRALCGGARHGGWSQAGCDGGQRCSCHGGDGDRHHVALGCSSVGGVGITRTVEQIVIGGCLSREP